MYRLSFLSAGCAAFLMLMNPGEEAYAEWAVQRLQFTACEQLSSLECRAATTIPRGLLKSTLKQYSYRQNFIFFSVYTTTFFEVNEHSIGVGGQFFRYL
jgi:hypothetical protein